MSSSYQPSKVFYINAVEQVASAMEMSLFQSLAPQEMRSLIGARNVTNLIADWVRSLLNAFI